VKQFGSFVQKYSLKGRKVIEIGCGRGDFLSIMGQCGADACGLEHSETSVAHCTRNGLKVAQGFVGSGDFWMDGAPFDAFFILNFLEHLPEPNSTLQGIRNIMADDSVGLVEVPNFDMILRNNLFSEFISDHLFYFTKATLSTTLSLNGFEIAECTEQWHDYVISAVVKKRAPLDISHFRECQAHLKRELERYIRRFGSKQVAIWGAGHQALAVIALLNLAGGIRYVVDSAVFKQGKYTPATHLPIVSPEALRSDPVRAVIVMAASYSDEVVRTIREQFGRNMKVSVLRDSTLEVA
jgi:hypothetical protein